MSKFHSTVSRRTFMKGLGLAGAGLGAAAAAAPVFHDLDEVAAASVGGDKMPWYIKERNYLDMTVDIDYALQKPYDAYNSFIFGASPAVTQNGYAYGNRLIPYVGQARGEELSASFNKMYGTPIPNREGYRLRDHAFKSASSHMIGYVDVTRWMNARKTPEQLGSPRWEGTPEQNAAMIRTVSRYWGADRVRYLPLDDKTKQFMYERTFGGAKVAYRDVDEPAVTSEEITVPNSFKYTIVPSVLSCYETNMRPISQIYNADITRACATESRYLNTYIMGFLKCLGYSGLAEGICGIGGFGVGSGMSELGRIVSQISPTDWYRNTVPVFTNLPLPANMPIDAGMAKFCDSCSKCADACPTGALHTGARTWENAVNPPNNFNQPGRLAWPIDGPKCIEQWCLEGSFCGMCAAVCVFNRLHDASIHDFIKGVVTNTSLLNPFFTNMDTVFGYGPRTIDQYEDFWTLGMDMPAFGKHHAGVK